MNDCFTGVEAPNTPLRISSLDVDVSIIWTASFASGPSNADAILSAKHSLRSGDAPSRFIPALMREALSTARALSASTAAVVEHADSADRMAADIAIAKTINLAFIGHSPFRRRRSLKQVGLAGNGRYHVPSLAPPG